MSNKISRRTFLKCTGASAAALGAAAMLGGCGSSTSDAIEVKVGDKVKAGTPLLKVDLDAIRAAGHPTATAIIVTNGDDLGELKMLAEGDILAGTPLFKF